MLKRKIYEKYPKKNYFIHKDRILLILLFILVYLNQRIEFFYEELQSINSKRQIEEKH